jgi:hypothetical protein
MKQLLLILILLISSFSFSQQSDTVPKKKKTFESFFGCECCQDTVQIHVVYKHKFIYECMLYKSQNLLIVTKKGKVIWKTDLKKDLENSNSELICIFDGKTDDKGNERLILSTGPSRIVVFYLKNGKRVK